MGTDRPQAEKSRKKRHRSGKLILRLRAPSGVKNPFRPMLLWLEHLPKIWPARFGNR